MKKDKATNQMYTHEAPFMRVSNRDRDESSTER
jgi:hypothetical protein